MCTHSLNDDVDQLIDREQARNHTTPTLLSWVLLVALTIVGLHFCISPGHATPPLIGEIRRFGKTEDLPKKTTSLYVQNRHASATDGPMCGPSVIDLEDVTPPTYMAVLTLEPPTEKERIRVEYALDACSGLRGPVRLVSDPFVVLALFRLEQDLGAPAGLLVGSWCVEAAMKTRGRYDGRFLGDWRDGKARASGPFQLHENVWGTTCQGTPDAPHDLLWAARCYWTEIQRVREKANKMVKCKTEYEMLRASEAASANIRRYGWSCRAKSAHWGMMEAMGAGLTEVE